jgi:hypothetical protein
MSNNKVAATFHPKKHQTKQWVKVRALVKPRLMAQLPQPCPRCGQVMNVSMRLDLGHISRDPAVNYDPSNLRLEHMHCNRKDGQRITTAKRKKPKIGLRMPRW